MALTREERQTIETLIKKVRALEDTLKSLSGIVENLKEIVLKFEATNMADWTDEEWLNFLRPFIVRLISTQGSICKHNHKNDQQGGDCFAKLGANLIDGEA
jgi:hypothetical protein